MNGKGEGEGRGDETASALMRSGDMRTRRPAKKRIVMHQRIALLTFPAQLSSYTRTPHRMQAMSRRIGMEVKQHVNFRFWRPMLDRKRCCQKKAAAAKSQCRRLLRGMATSRYHPYPHPILLDWGNIKLVVWPHDSGVFLCGMAALRYLVAFSSTLPDAPCPKLCPQPASRL